MKLLAAVLSTALIPAATAVAPAEAAPGNGLVPFKIVMENGLPTIPAPLTAVPGDPKAGEQVAVERHLGNCLSCHMIGALAGEEFHGEIGPPLDGVAQRWDAAALRMIIVNPKQVFGAATAMPAFYRIDGLNRVRPEFAGRPILTAQQVEDLVAYLMTIK